MLCPRCGAENPSRAGNCHYCGEPLAARQGRQAETGSAASVPDSPGEPAAIDDVFPSTKQRVRRMNRSGPSAASPQVAENMPETPLEEEADVFRELFAEVVEINRRIKLQKRSIDTEALAGLYTARSFSSPEAMGRTAGAIRELLRTNRRLAAELERALERIKSRVESARWSRADKMRFWNKVADGFLARFRMRPAILEKQEQWTEATIDLYEFVLAHSDELSFEGKSVQTSDRETGEEFVLRLKRAKRLRDAFRAATERAGDMNVEPLGRRKVPDPS